MFGLLPRVLNTIRKYFSSKDQITSVIVFGSCAMGNEAPGSDNDLALITNIEGDISGKIPAELELHSTPYIFYVIDYQWITNLTLRDHIDRVERPFFQ